MAESPQILRREVGVFAATMMGLGSILGTGVFVSIGVAAGIAGTWVVAAIAVAAVVAICNGLSSAQLAANHPVSGGTYEYGYRWLNPSFGFTAGWMFLCAKSASAATAALGLSGYALNLVGQTESGLALPLAIGAVGVLTLVVLTGIRRSAMANTVIVSMTIVSLLVFVIVGARIAMHTDHFQPDSSEIEVTVAGFLQACALMFVAYTGYGRIATLGEEITNPRRNIPFAIIVTLLFSMALYVAVGGVAMGVAGADGLAAAVKGTAAPWVTVSRSFDAPAVPIIIAIGAVTAMAGVLLNLILGLSRVLLAMGRRGDAPAVFAQLDVSGATPYAAVIAVGVFIAGLTAIGDVRTTWSFSAFTVLVYYSLTNLAALRLRPEERLYPRTISVMGLVSCLFLAFWVTPVIWMVGLGLIGVGLAWHWGRVKWCGHQ